MLVTFVMIYMLCLWYMFEWGPLREKKRISLVTLPGARAMAHGKVTIWAGLGEDLVVCHGRGTRRTDQASPWHTAKPLFLPLCRWAPPHGFAVCRLLKRTTKSLSPPCAGARGTRWIHPDAADQSASTLSPYFFFAVYLDIHTTKVFVVCPKYGTWQTRHLPCPWLPSAVRRRPPSAKTSPCAWEA